MDKVGVFPNHLEEIYVALDAAHTYHASLDLADACRAVKAQTGRSRLTAALERALERVEGYLVDAEAEDGS